jgi:hypothetical protein
MPHHRIAFLSVLVVAPLASAAWAEQTGVRVTCSDFRSATTVEVYA